MTQTIGWPTILKKLLAKGDLTRQEAGWAMTEIMDGSSSEAEIGAFMMALRSKGETVEELSGLVDVMLEKSVLIIGLKLTTDAPLPSWNFLICCRIT